MRLASAIVLFFCATLLVFALFALIPVRAPTQPLGQGFKRTAADLCRAKPLVHQVQRGLTERSNAAFVHREKAREEPVHVAVNAVGSGRGVAHDLVAVAGGDAQIGVGRRQIRHRLSAPIQTTAGNAQQIQRVAGGLKVGPLLLGFPQVLFGRIGLSPERLPLGDPLANT